MTILGGGGLLIISCGIPMFFHHQCSEQQPTKFSRKKHFSSFFFGEDSRLCVPLVASGTTIPACSHSHPSPPSSLPISAFSTHKPRQPRKYTRAMQLLLPLFILLQLATALGADFNKPHHHQGKVQPFKPGRPDIKLSGGDLDLLTKGKHVSTKVGERGYPNNKPAQHTEEWYRKVALLDADLPLPKPPSLPPNSDPQPLRTRWPRHGNSRR